MRAGVRVILRVLIPKNNSPNIKRNSHVLPPLPLSMQNSMIVPIDITKSLSYPHTFIPPSPHKHTTTNFQHLASSISHLTTSISAPKTQHPKPHNPAPQHKIFHKNHSTIPCYFSQILKYQNRDNYRSTPNHTPPQLSYCFRVSLLPFPRLIQV